MPLQALAIRKGSSPDSSGERKMVLPSLTTGPEVFFPLYPLLRMATGIPLSINPFANAITKGVFPVPPTVILPTLMTGQGRRLCFQYVKGIEKRSCHEQPLHKVKRGGKEEKEEFFPQWISLFDKGIGRYAASQFKISSE